MELDIVKLGSADQKERWHAGTLPEDELLSLARGVLFAPFNDIPRWQMLEPEEVHHTRDCRASKAVEFMVVDRVRLTRSEWATLNRISALTIVASDLAFLQDVLAFEVKLRCHLARCSACHAEIDGMSALVSVSWAGRTLSREYAL